MGAAGAVTMRTLVDAGFKVIGIEAGGNHDTDPLILDSLNAFSLGSSYIWKYFFQQESVPNASMGNRVFSYTTGRLLGGGSSINGLLYVRGSNDFWQEWADINGSDWSPTAVLNGYKALEKFLGVTGQFNPSVHGTNGLMRIRQCPTVTTALTTKFTTALATATSLSVIADYNDPSTPIGVFSRWSLFEKPNGDRASTSTDFLKPLLNTPSNDYDFLLNTTVTKVILSENGQVKGVHAIHNGKYIKIKARKKVILSCGIHSCEILQRSGIGPQSLLDSMNIPVIFANDAVGANSKNHLGNITAFTANPADFPGTGPDIKSLYTGGALLPDPTIGSDPTKRAFRWGSLNLPANGPVPPLLLVGFSLLTMKSIGTDHILDKDPLRTSEFSENLLSNSDDLTSIINVFQQQLTAFATQLATIDPFYQLISPPLAVINDTNALTQYIIENANHEHHWTGTCAMAPLTDGGVVDNRGRVYGTNGLRVVDISVCPIQTDGNTTGPAILVGHKIAKMIIAGNS